MKIQFYDVSESQELAHLNGQILTLSELYGHHISNRPGWPKPQLSFDEFNAMDFHPFGVGQGGWKSWVAYFSTSTFLLSGHTPSKDEVKIIREYIRRLPNEFKRSYLDRKFVLSFISYLFIGFKGHVQGLFHSNSNSVNDLVEFTLSLHATKRTLLTSFLCAHRDPKIDDELNLLQSSIPSKKIRRTAALVLALGHNINNEVVGNAIFLQQGVSFAATSSVFPEVTVEYLERAQAHVMLNRLRYQQQRVSETVTALPGDRVSARLVTLDVLTSRIERFLRDRYGPEWRYLDFTSYEFEEDPIVEIAIHMTLPGIERMLPFFSGDFQQTVLARKVEIIEKNQSSAFAVGGETLAVEVTKVIEWFMLQHSMTISAKAVYEVAFYYLWGKYVGRFNGTFAIGFDREHDRFQHFAWKCGAESVHDTNEVRQSVPLYARRNPGGREHGMLTDLSFRQFWRYNT